MVNAGGALLKLKQAMLHIPRAGRYIRPVLRHWTPKKLANILHAETELRLGRTTLRSYPYYYLIDICNACNLRCPLCSTGNDTIGRKQGMMSFKEYKTILDKVSDYALVVSLYNLGEPFLNRDIFKIIEYTSGKGITTNLSSNFNWPIPVDPKDIVRSGLEYIAASVDGVSQEAYQKYRVRGDIKEVFDNIRGLLAARKELKKKTPFVEWQYIVFKHNEHEMDEARRLAVELGVDLLRFVSPAVEPWAPDQEKLREQWMPMNPLFWERNPLLVDQRGYIHDKSCFYLYRCMSVAPGGGVSPCCFAHEERHDFGNLLTSSVDDLWNNREYRSARMLFSRVPPQEERLRVLCDDCTMFRRDGAHLCGVLPAGRRDAQAL
jgi:MoaA/NifB/PqqE/SkfB family radical SAM enzyme